MSSSSGGNAVPSGQGGQASKKKPINKMSMSQMKEELQQSYGVVAVESIGNNKKKLMKALQEARKKNHEHTNQQQQDVAPPSSPTTSPSSNEEAQNTPNTKTEAKPNATTAQNEKYGLLPEGRGTKKNISEMTIGEMKEELHFCYGFGSAVLWGECDDVEEETIEVIEETLKNARSNLPSSSGPIREIIFDLNLWKSKFPVAAKTKDPLALDHDKAHLLYEKSIQLFRQGEHKDAAECVASAYLLWPDSVALGSGDEFLGHGELVDLVRFAKEKALWTYPILSACAIVRFIDQKQGENGHNYSINLLFHLRDMAGKTEQGPFGLFCTSLCGSGQQARAKLHYIAADICEKMRDGDASAIEYRKALEADPNYPPARIARVYGRLHLESTKLEDVYSELMSILDCVHEDYCDLEFVYAMMCEVLMQNPFVGTFEDLISYYEKALKAVDRRVELYGIPSQHSRCVFQILEDIRPLYENQHCERAQARKDLVTVSGAIPTRARESQKYRNICCVCKKDDTGERLMRCAGCKTVWYCSKECQAKHWPEHKVGCKALEKVSKKTGA